MLASMTDMEYLCIWDRETDGFMSLLASVRHVKINNKLSDLVTCVDERMFL